MFIKYYLKITEPFKDSIIKILFDYPGFALITAIIIILFGLFLLILPKRSVNFIIYSHTSFLVAIIAWKILDSCFEKITLSMYFFIGVPCALITYILNSRQLISRRKKLVLVLILFYLPFLDISYDMNNFLVGIGSFLVLVLCFKLPKKNFEIFCITFIGSCLIASAISFFILKCEENVDYINNLLAPGLSFEKRFLLFFEKKKELRGAFLACIRRRLNQLKNSSDFMKGYTLGVLFFFWFIGIVFNYYIKDFCKTKNNKNIHRTCDSDVTLDIKNLQN